MICVAMAWKPMVSQEAQLEKKRLTDSLLPEVRSSP